MFPIRLAFLLLALTTLTAKAGDWQLDPHTGEGRLEFEAIATPGSLKIPGKIAKNKEKSFQWLIKQKGGKLLAVGKFKVEDFDTGMALRNSHLKENYLQVAKFPEATFKLNALPWPEDKREVASSGIPFTGELTLHGKTKTVSGELTASKKEKGTEMKFRFPIHLGDFEIPIPSFMGVNVAEEVWVTAEFAPR